jgi:hypothetical protein
MGLPLGKFDSMGQLRTSNISPIDITGELNGKTFVGARGLGKTLSDSPQVSQCLVRHLYAYGTGHEPVSNDQAYLQQMADSFAEEDYRFKSLLKHIATSDRFLQPTTQAIENTEYSRGL